MLTHVNGHQITCDGKGCITRTGVYDRRTSAVFEAVRGGWCRLGKEWFCPTCAWDVEIGPTGPVPVPVDTADVLVRIAE